MAMAKDFDIFHFYYGESLSGSRLVDVPWLRRMGKKVFFYFCGCDLRDSKAVIERHAISACAECWPMGCSANRDAATAAAAESDGVFVSTPDLLEFMPGATLLLQPIDLQRFDVLRQAALARTIRADDGVVRIAHAPSNRTIKGTIHIVAAVNELERRGRQVELVLVEGRSHVESLALYNSCDIAIDQVLIGAYGQFSVETMALGKPTVCYVRNDLRSLYPGEVPIVSGDPTNLADVLDELIERRETWEDLGERGVAYVAQAHDVRRVATVAARAYGLSGGATS